MTVEQLARECSFTPACLPDPDREIDGCYMGDLLSWVMGRADSDNVWITIMSNTNIVAVASLADVSCILLAEGVVLDDDVLALSRDKGINILYTDHPQYRAAICVHTALQD